MERFEKSSLRFRESKFLPYRFFWAATVSYIGHMGALFGSHKTLEGPQKIATDW